MRLNIYLLELEEGADYSLSFVVFEILCIWFYLDLKLVYLHIASHKY